MNKYFAALPASPYLPEPARSLFPPRARPGSKMRLKILLSASFLRSAGRNRPDRLQSCVWVRTTPGHDCDQQHGPYP